MKKLIMNFVTTFLLIIATSFNTKQIELPTPILKNIVVEKPKSEITYIDSLIAFIPRHEGTRNNVYSCSAGKRTIGNGHVITKKDRHLKFPITDAQIDSLLKADVLKAKYYVEKNIPDSIQLSDRMFWMIVHFTFCKGIGNFNKSTLKKHILNGSDTSKINDELKKWCRYHKPNGEFVRSKWSYRIRLAEIEFLKNGSFGNIF